MTGFGKEYPGLVCKAEPGCDGLVTHSARYKNRSHYKGPGIPVCQKHYSRWHRGDITMEGHPPPERTHGIISTYQSGCRCDLCTEAARLYRRRFRIREYAARDDAPYGCRYCPAQFRTTRAVYHHENAHERDMNGKKVA